MLFCVKRWLGWERGVAYVSLWILMKDDVETVFACPWLPLSNPQVPPSISEHFRAACLASVEKIKEQAGETPPQSTFLCLFPPASLNTLVVG